MKFGIGLGVVATVVVGGAVVAAGLAGGACVRTALCLPIAEEEVEEEEEEEEEESMWTSFVTMAFGTDYGFQPEPSPSATQAPATG